MLDVISNLKMGEDKGTVKKWVMLTHAVHHRVETHPRFPLLLPCQFVEVGEHSLGNVFYEVMVHI